MMDRTPKPVDMEVGRRIREMRKARRISQSVLAEQLGVTFQQVQKYEKGTNRVSASALVEIAAALGVRAGSLLPADHQDRESGAINQLLAELDALKARLAKIAELATASEAKIDG